MNEVKAQQLDNMHVVSMEGLPFGTVRPWWLEGLCQKRGGFRNCALVLGPAPQQTFWKVLFCKQQPQLAMFARLVPVPTDEAPAIYWPCLWQSRETAEWPWHFVIQQDKFWCFHELPVVPNN